MPNIAATEPELLAHHYNEAKQPEKAIPLWQKAGSLALVRMALAEAIAHLNKGLELVAALPASAERDGSELDLRTLSGTAVDGAQRLAGAGGLGQLASGATASELAASE